MCSVAGMDFRPAEQTGVFYLFSGHGTRSTRETCPDGMFRMFEGRCCRVWWWCRMGGGHLGVFDMFGVRGWVGGRWTGQTCPDGDTHDLRPPAEIAIVVR